MLYRYEMHLHSKGCSACAVSDSREYVVAAKNNGYAGLVFTNHFYRGNTAVDRKLPWREFVEAYRQDYLAAKQYGDELNIDVLFGLEQGYSPGKEALIYGLEPELIATAPELQQMDLAQLSAFVRGNGGFFVCAHPFRNRSYIPDPEVEPDTALFDAIEVYNQGNTAEDNRKAADFALRTGIAQTSGGDIHSAEAFGRSGLAFRERIRDGRALVHALKAGAYRLIVEGECR